MSVVNLSDYERDGFLVIPGFVPASICDALMTRAREIVDAFVPTKAVGVFTTNDQVRKSDAYFLESGDKVRCFLEEEAVDARTGELLPGIDKSVSVNKIGHALHDLDSVFERFSKSDRVNEVVAQLKMDKPTLVQSMYIFKNPRIGGDVSCHQDSTFLHTTPLSVVGLWFALEDATIENGCMWALPGGHKTPLRKRFKRNQEGTGTIMEEIDKTPLPDPSPSNPWVALEAKKGTLIVLHGQLPHWSSANRSPVSRHAYALHYVDDNCQWSKDNWLHRRDRWL